MPTVGSLPTQMKAAVYTEHGPPDGLTLADVPVPVPKERQVLIRVRAAAINPLDWHVLRAEPSFLKMMARGDQKIPGVDIAGVVEKVGAKITQFRPGDEVFGSTTRACAQYACTGADKVVRKPAQLTFEQAAAIPVPAYTAVHALRDFGRLQSGQTVLINGASGGVGTFAVQIARALGAEVTGVCSTRNLELVRSIGAHHVIDYTTHDFAAMGRHYDVVLQVCGNRTKQELRRALTPNGRAVLVGGGTGRDPDEQIRIGAILADMAGNLYAPFVRQKVLFCMASGRASDLLFINELVEAGKLMPVIDRTYPLAEAGEAIRYLETGHARGKVVITV